MSTTLTSGNADRNTHVNTLNLLHRNRNKLNKMSKYPCGICDIGVKYQGIQCTRTCERWFHAKCLAWSSKKFKNLTDNDINTWSCDSCKPNDNAVNIENLKSKIQDLSSRENFDPDESLTLAAELGNALLSENNNLKQQIHEIKLEKSQHELALEDKLNLAEEIINELKGKNQNLHHEIKSLQNKLEIERVLREEFIKQVETESNSQTRRIKDMSSLNTALKNKIKNIEAVKTAINTELDDLKLKNTAQKEKIDLLSHTLERAKQETNNLKHKLLEYDDTIKLYIKKVLENLEPHPAPDYLPSPKPQLPGPTPTSCTSENLTETTKQHHTQESKINQPLNNPQVHKTPATYFTGNSTDLKTSKNLLSRGRKPPVRWRKNIFSISLQVAKNQKNKVAHAVGNEPQSAPAKPHHEKNINLDKKELNGIFKVAKTPPHTATKLGPSETIQEFFDKNARRINSTTLEETKLIKTAEHQTQDIFLEMNSKGRAKEKQTNSSTD
ncbi:hypothetical protein J6590_096493 [Homalodisca vitripennis]|nr:hypothetical protein J6590_096493 [Homalodisca vitripennis]